jgi:protein TonB
MDPAKILSSDFLDILFDNRNKEYGAYELRRQYEKRVRNSILITSSIALLIVGSYLIYSNMKGDESTKVKPIVKETILEDIEIPPEDPKAPPPPPPPPAAPPPAVKPTVQFTPPVIKEDKEVREEEEPPKMEDLKNTVISTKTVEGDPDGIDPGLISDSKGTGVVEAPPPPAKEQIFTFVEQQPEFPGGEAALRKFLFNNIRYPSMANDAGIEGVVSVSFVVDSEGVIKDVKTTGAPKGGGLEEEALRVVKKMPKWKPGRQNGQNVSVQYYLPIRFTLTNQ